MSRLKTLECFSILRFQDLKIPDFQDLEICTLQEFQMFRFRSKVQESQFQAFEISQSQDLKI